MFVNGKSVKTAHDLPAPAKLNLFLHVLGRRPDGYHRLQTAFRFIDLCDVLHIDVRSDVRITREGGLPDVAVDDDLTVRAARALQSATGTRQGAHIALTKHIPAGGGLGGGSSDAASVLIALNCLWQTGLTRQDLQRLALPLGADVPVFIFGQSAFAEGVGEVLTPITLPPRAYLVVQPAAHVATAEVFGAPDLPRDTAACSIDDFLHQGAPPSPPTPLPGGEGHLSVAFGNDLEPVVRARYPAVDAALSALHQLAIPARMTGSGACLYAEYATEREAVLAQKQIAATMRVADFDARYCRDGTDGKHTAPIVWTRTCQGLDEHPLAHWIAD